MSKVSETQNVGSNSMKLKDSKTLTVMRSVTWATEGNGRLVAKLWKIEETFEIL